MPSGSRSIDRLCRQQLHTAKTRGADAVGELGVSNDAPSGLEASSTPVPGVATNAAGPTHRSTRDRHPTVRAHSETRRRATRKMPSRAGSLAVIIACAAGTCCAACGSTSQHDSSPSTSITTQPPPAPAAPPSPTPTPSPTGLLSYVPAALQSDCADTGTSGHFPAWISGYTDSVTCSLGQPSEEADYYQFASTSAMSSAFNTAAIGDNQWGSYGGGGCSSGDYEEGTWSYGGGSTVGDIACPGTNNMDVSLIWDDSNTDIIGVVDAEYSLPANVYSWWQSNGASIDGSSQSATSS